MSEEFTIHSVLSERYERATLASIPALARPVESVAPSAPSKGSRLAVVFSAGLMIGAAGGVASARAVPEPPHYAMRAASSVQHLAAMAAAPVEQVAPVADAMSEMPVPTETAVVAPTHEAVAPSRKSEPALEVTPRVPAREPTAKEVVPAAVPEAVTPPSMLESAGSAASIEGPEPDRDSPPHADAAPLTPAVVHGVVASRQAAVSRRCWEPALEKNAGIGSSGARVAVTIEISPDGTVGSVTAQGAERDFPDLSACVSSRVKAWQFPASGAATRVNIPFVFASR